MKKINFKLYLIGFLFLLFGITSHYITKGMNHFTTIFIGVISTIGFINTASILFYKTLNSNDEVLKYVFSFLHITIFAFIFYLYFI